MKTKSFYLTRAFAFATLMIGSLVFTQPLSAQQNQQKKQPQNQQTSPQDARKNNPNKKTPEERAKMMTDRMKEKLVLTDAQYTPVYNIHLKYAKKNEELKQSTEDKKAKGQKFQALQTEKDKELKTVLTDEQYKKYQALKQEKKDEMKEKAKEKKKEEKQNKSTSK